MNLARRNFAVTTAVVLGVTLAAHATTYYVKPAAQGGSDSANGTSWDTAFATPNKGFSTVNSKNQNHEVLIAPGVYELSGAIGCNGGQDDYTRVMVRGTTDNPEDVVLRSPGNQEILRLAKNITVANMTFENGSNYKRYSNGTAGIRVGGNNNLGTLSIVSNCIVRSCKNEYVKGQYGGPAVVLDDGLLVDCVVSNNTAAWRGCGVTLGGPNATALRCVITGNDATSSEEGGVSVMGCGCNSNSLDGSGGGRLVDCVVTNNIGIYFAGVFNVPKVSGCLFEGNEASTSVEYSRGGGLFVNTGVAEITNCVFRGNKAYFGGGAYVSGIPATLSDCLFEANSVFAGGGGACVEGAANAVVEGCRFLGNVTTGGDTSASNNEWGGSGLFIRKQTLDSWCAVSNCVFGSNSTQCRGGAFAATWNGLCQAEIMSCVFTNNSSLRQGGAISIRETTAHTTKVSAIRNSLIVNNRTTESGTACNGAGIILVSTNAVEVANCTIANNITAYAQGGGIYQRWGGRFINCIIANNKVSGGSKDEPTTGTICTDDDGTFLNCCMYPTMISHFTAANGCINADPKFTDVVNGDFTLQRSSPCRNAGTAIGLSWMADAFDLSGEVPRISESVPDMGCYEIPESFKHTILIFN